MHPELSFYTLRVDESLRIKVADFGLTRDIYSTEYYRIEKHTTLPVKWMALESLLDGYFDEKTDVVCITICVYMCTFICLVILQDLILKLVYIVVIWSHLLGGILTWQNTISWCGQC